jgi:hypothetical protein
VSSHGDGKGDCGHESNVLVARPGETQRPGFSLPLWYTALPRGPIPHWASMLGGRIVACVSPSTPLLTLAPSPYTRTYVPHCGHGLPHDRPGFALRQQSLTPPPWGWPDAPAPCRSAARRGN